MYNFTYDIGTIVHFGQGQIAALPEAVKKYGKKVLLAYGGGSIKRMGLYDKVTQAFKDNGIEWVELSGIEPNPRHTSVNEGAKLCRENDVDVIVAVGGGSTIDCSKLVACATFYDGDSWDIVTRKVEPVKHLPIISILTLSATGSEMNGGAVISNLETNDKEGFAHPNARPKVSILDPTYTYTVPQNQTAAGTADIISHLFEVYFTKVKDAYMQDRICEALLKTCFHYGRIAMDDPENYEARANLMWASSWAINGFIAGGKANAWTVHPMEHQLSAYFDITHGIGLAILTPAWMEYILNDDTVDKFVEFGTNVFNIDANQDQYAIAQQAIQRTYDEFAAMDIPMRLSEVGITEDKLEIMAEKSARTLADAYVPLTKDDVLAIYKACF